MTSTKEDSYIPTERDYDQFQGDYNRVRREMMHWHPLAKLRKERALAIERIFGHFKKHWKFLLLLVLLSIFTLPLLPILALILIPRTGRNILLAVAAKIPRLNQALGIFVFKLRELWQIRQSGTETPIYRRSQRSYPPPVDPGNSDLHHLLHQLSPQNRQVMQRFRLITGELVEATEYPSYQSLSQSEISLFRVCAALAANPPEDTR
jgi:hypothetical protein